MKDPRHKSAEKLEAPAPLPLISRRALARVEHPVAPPVSCSYCNHSVALVNNKEVYGKEFGLWPYMYFCSECGASVGLHQFTDLPLGTMADKKLRESRKAKKSIFNAMLKKLSMSRNEGYAMLSEKMNVPIEKCHWAMFNENKCWLAGRLCLVEINKANREAA